MKRGPNSNLDEFAPPTKKPKPDEEFLKHHQDNFHLENFSKLIFSDSLKKVPFSIGRANLKTVIFNQTEFCEGLNTTLEPHYLIGAKLTLDDKTPIGYNIHITHGEIKGIIVQVYGGDLAKERTQKMYLPGILDPMCHSLANKGFVIVTLNLLDLIENNAYQAYLPHKLHKRLHASINYFFEAFKYFPWKIEGSQSSCQLSQALFELQDKKVFLLGGSFGGRTAIKHAELYPHTFDGYISFAGCLSYEMWKKCTGYQVKALPWVEAINDINSIEDPILLLHNMDDNRVNVKVSLNWYKKAIKAGKKDKISLWFTEQGGPIIPQDPALKGHFVSNDLTSYSDMICAIVQFIDKGHYGQISALHEWRAHRYNILANKNYFNATFIQRFISHAYRHYKEGKALDEENYKKYYGPLFYTLYYLHFTNNVDIFKEIHALNAQHRLTKEVITAAVKMYLPKFNSYLKERDLIDRNENNHTDMLANHAELQEQYKQRLLGSIHYNVPLYKHGINALYLANPWLLQEKYTMWDKDPLIQLHLKASKAMLQNKINKEHELRKSVWQQAVKKIGRRI